jgi:hypothetical protein
MPRLDVHDTLILSMSLFFGKITNVDNGTSPITPIIGHVECNAFDHILYVCNRILLAFQHSASSSSVIRRPVVGLVRHFLRILSLALDTFLTIPPNSDCTVCVYWRADDTRTYQSLMYVPVFALTYCGCYPFHPSSNPCAHWAWLLLSHNYLMSTFGFGGNRLYDPAI